jgi:hypothetical protein
MPQSVIIDSQTLVSIFIEASMNIIAILVLVAASLVLMSMSTMDVIFGMDLFGRGWGPQFSGGIAILTGITALFLAMRPCSTRKTLVVVLAASLVAVRCYRLAFAHGAFSWDSSGWLIVALMFGLPLAIMGASILIRPTTTSRPIVSNGGKTGSS